ncbi:hypothetical protein NDU88_006278 [Pleurodeles waltl]|uniref:Uncharacterized protein n=1 Tax=Pleurodeles waltl TaxID=8319 RepID=A0AAV7QKX3_PLEWA|nr:hypothetical protein NDU88_006278 [Pleurodeles waltl]
MKKDVVMSGQWRVMELGAEWDRGSTQPRFRPGTADHGKCDEHKQARDSKWKESAAPEGEDMIMEERFEAPYLNLGAILRSPAESVRRLSMWLNILAESYQLEWSALEQQAQTAIRLLTNYHIVHCFPKAGFAQSSIILHMVPEK